MVEGAAIPPYLQLEIVTPSRRVVQVSVSSVSMPGKGGYLGILPGHAPLLTQLQTGKLTYTRDGVTQHLAVSGGFAEVLPDRVIILATAAELADEIDVPRATQAKARAEDRLKRYLDPDVDMDRARSALQRALTRLSVARR